MNHDIFISYSSKQKSIADGVCHYLEENGFKCWMAPRDIAVGSEYGDLIEEAIKTCKIVVLVFSQSASISKWVKGEINVAFTEDKPILPFRIDETEITGGFRVMLNQMHWIDAFPQYADRLPDLLNSVCGFLGRQPHKVSDDNERLEAERKAKEERLERECAEAQQWEQRAAEANLTAPSADAKTKKGLWIGIGMAAVIVGLVLLLVLPKKQSLSVSGTVNGHDYVDLGLPSGTLWATCNVGASKPEDYGNYYAWGETSTKSTYNWSTYKYCNGDEDQLTKYCNDSAYGYYGFTDNLTVLQSGDDAAAANWGADWRMPNGEEYQELLDNTTSQWTTRNGVEGLLFISNKNGQTLFLPAAGYLRDNELIYVGSYGYYWSSSLYTGSPSSAWYFSFYSGDCHMYGRSRGRGPSVRAVRSTRQN